MNGTYLIALFLMSIFVQEASLYGCSASDPQSCSTSRVGCKGIQSGPRSIYVIRSTGANSTRELIGWQDRINNYSYDHEDKLWGSGTFALEYQQTFKPEAIAQELFGGQTVWFKGSQVAGRSSRDILADYFGLPTDYVGALHIAPSIQNWTAEVQAYWGLDRWLPGFYFRMNAPLVHTVWNLNACTRDLSNAVPLFPPCYMGVADQDPVTSPLESLVTLKDALIGYPAFGDKTDRRHFGNFDFDGNCLVRIADVDLIMGYNFVHREGCHLGINAYFVLPFGNKPEPELLFSPVVGNGRHYELGIGLSGHADLWIGSEQQRLAIYVEGNCTHLFANIQGRSFDFCQNGPLSRYLLLKEIGQLQSPQVAVADTNAYALNLINAIDWSTRCASVSIPVKGDVTFKVAFKGACYGADLGYNLYGQAEEKVQLLPAYTNVNDSMRFGIKGLLGTEYFVTSAVGSPTGVATLNSTASQATLFKANLSGQETTDNPVAVVGPGTFGYSGNPLANQQLVAGETGTDWQHKQAYYSGQGYPNQTNPGPDLVELTDLNSYSAAGRGFLTHKFFGYMSYTGRSCLEPFIGIGGEIEFEWGAHRGAHTQWGALCKMGLSY